MERPVDADDVSWPIRCSDTVIGGADKALNLSGVNLMGGIFARATFLGEGLVSFARTNLASAIMHGARIIASLSNGKSLVDFTDTDTTDTDMSGLEITADTSYYAIGTIDFTGTELATAKLTDWELTAETIIGLKPPSPPAPPAPPAPPPSPPSLKAQLYATPS